MKDSANPDRIDPGHLAALAGSRLCHDLISPLGAIGNGVELLGLTGDYPQLANTPEMQLISESIIAAGARVRSFRLAFGVAQPEQRMGRPDIEAAIRDLTATSRLSVAYEVEGDFPRTDIKMLMLALMCLETAMCWGGRVIICRAGLRWRLVGECLRLRVDAGLWAWLDAGDDPDCHGNDGTLPVPPQPLTPTDVHFGLLALEAARSGHAVHYDIDQSGAEITF